MAENDVVVLPSTEAVGSNGGRANARYRKNSESGGMPPDLNNSQNNNNGNNGNSGNTGNNNNSSNAAAAFQDKAMVAKVVLLGESGVGKSSLVLRYVEGQFSPVTKSTIGASFFTKRLLYDGVKAKLQIWDTAGQERFRSLAPMFYRGAAAAVVIYDITNGASFERMKSWVKELQNNVKEEIVLVIVGNKADQAASRAVDTSVVEEFVRACGAASYFETSAKNNVNVDECFAFIARTLVVKYKETLDANGRPLDNSFNNFDPTAAAFDDNPTANVFHVTSLDDNNNNNNNNNGNNNNNNNNNPNKKSACCNSS